MVRVLDVTLPVRTLRKLSDVFEVAGKAGVAEKETTV